MYDKFYVREAEDYDVDNGLLELGGADPFEVKKNLQTTTSRYFFPKSYVFVAVEKRTERILGVVSLIINKRLGGTKVGNISGMLMGDNVFVITRTLGKYALDVAIQDGCVSVDVVCDGCYVDAFRSLGFTSSERFYADLPLQV